MVEILTMGLVIMVAVLVFFIYIAMQTDKQNETAFAEKEKEIVDVKLSAEQRVDKYIDAHNKVVGDRNALALENMILSRKLERQKLKLKRAGQIVSESLNEREELLMQVNFLKAGNMVRKLLLKMKEDEISELKKTQAFASAGAKAVRKNRKTYPKKKLTERDVEQIKKLSGAYSQSVLAKEYGVSRQMISKIKRGK